ncbi:MAG: NAD-dependent epimerase/dehydratase family protein [Bacteroidota bacterium]
MTALVTGATGFIGSHLVELLLKKNYAVRILVRKTSDLTWIRNLPVEMVYGDLFDARALDDAVRGVEYIFHSAGVTKAKEKSDYFRGNTEGTRNVLHAVRRVNPTLKRFVQISSQTAVGPSPTRVPIAEDVPASPITTYGRSKWEAEEACRSVAGEVPVTIVRPPAVYGPRDKDVFEFFATMSRGLQPMVGMREKYVSLIHVGDLVRGILMAAEAEVARGRTYFISSSGVYGWKQVGEVTRRVLGKRAMRLKIPEFGVYAVATFAEFFSLFSSRPALINYEKARDMVQDYWTCSGEKARRELGFEQEIGLEEGIRGTVAWYKQMGWL